MIAEMIGGPLDGAKIEIPDDADIDDEVIAEEDDRKIGLIIPHTYVVSYWRRRVCLVYLPIVDGPLE